MQICRIQLTAWYKKADELEEQEVDKQLAALGCSAKVDEESEEE